ncbi:MAG: c-type cytochrome [Flavobacteriales bacterium]|nr:c-type cytochrome [Flavobacteriales bacterium]
MLKFIKHHLDTISGIGIYPVISFLLFFGFFLAMLIWIRKVSSAHIARMSALPLAEDRPEPTTVTKSTGPSLASRVLALVLTAGAAMPLLAQEAPVASTNNPAFQVDNSLNYAMIALAVVQVIFILALTGIMRTMGGAGAWAKRFAQRNSRAAVLLPFLFLFSLQASAQAYKGEGGTISNYHLFWLLAATNALLFVIVVVQIVLLRGLIAATTGVEKTSVELPLNDGPTWVERLTKRLTRQVEVEKEEDILMHHEYDGIRELDNVLPPWWVWLFYGSIIWSVFYLAGTVMGFLPDQKTEYANSMEQAKLDIAAYTAKLGASVDENTVTASTDPGTLAAGRNIFTQYCTPCHGADGAGSETSVGPNLTDAYWIHGGGVKNIFYTIKYGVQEKGMISWKSQLKPAEMASFSSYILSLQGTGPATQKPPQGDLWTEPLPSDSTANTVDSLAASVDTTRMAAK